jgi:hypothetical protein
VTPVSFTTLRIQARGEVNFILTVPIVLQSIHSKNVIAIEHLGNHGRHELLMEAHIVIEEQQKLTSRCIGPPIQSRRETHILFERKPTRAETLNYICRSVRRRIIYDDNLQGSIRLTQQGRQTGFEIASPVPVHHNR